MLDQLLFRIDMVQDHIGIALVRSREYDHLEVAIYHFEAFVSEGSDVEPCSQLPP